MLQIRQLLCNGVKREHRFVSQTMFMNYLIFHNLQIKHRDY